MFVLLGFIGLVKSQNYIRVLYTSPFYLILPTQPLNTNMSNILHMETLRDLVEKFNIVSNKLCNDKFKQSRPILEIKLNESGNLKETFTAQFYNVDIKDGCILKTGPVGYGATPEEAMVNYYNLIVNKKIVWNSSLGEYRTECVVV